MCYIHYIRIFFIHWKSKCWKNNVKIIATGCWLRTKMTGGWSLALRYSITYIHKYKTYRYYIESVPVVVIPYICYALQLSWYPHGGGNPWQKFIRLSTVKEICEVIWEVSRLLVPSHAMNSHLLPPLKLSNMGSTSSHTYKTAVKR